MRRDNIFVSSDIVGCIVEAEVRMAINAVVVDMDIRSVVVVELLVRAACQMTHEMVFQVGKE